MTQIIGISGKKQSGKNTAINFIVGLHMTSLGLIRENFTITPQGELYISDINGDKDYEGVFDIMRGTPSMQIFLEDNLDDYLRVYSYADLLKQEVCMKILGLTYEQCFGTDAQKNSITYLKWEDMPGMTTPTEIVDCFMQACVDGDSYESLLTEPLKTGLMTAREVMQYVGTNIFRKMYGNVWVDATIKRIKDEGSAVALICDVRFPNEVEGAQKAGGKVMRLTRNPHPEDNHSSEMALDNYTGFDTVIDNASSTIIEQNDLIYNTLKTWNMLPIELDVNQ